MTGSDNTTHAVTSTMTLHGVEQVSQLQAKLAQAEHQLQQERDKAALLSIELQRLRLSTSGGSTPTPVSPAAPAVINGNTSSTISTIPQSTTNNSAGATFNPSPSSLLDNEMVSIRKSDLDFLLLKEKALDAVKEGITIASATEPDMPLIYFNEGFVRITGYTHQDALGKNCRFLQGKDTDTEVVKLISDSIKAGQACVTQLMNYRRNGEPFVNYLALTPIHDANGVLTHYVGIQADVSDLISHQKAELAAKHAALQAAAATEAKSQFLARMSHEIRTPLNGMIAVGQLLADTQLSPAQWDLVNTIRCSGEALLTLITDILDFSRIEANKMVLSSAPFRLEAVIEAAMEIAGMQASKKRLQVAYHIADDVPRSLVGDAQRLQQVLLNIVNNALKFTELGEVLLEVWCQERHAPCDTADAQDSKTGSSANKATPSKEIHFSVRDTGIGIQPKDLGQLFQSFSQLDSTPTRRYGGSGLGLTISQKLTEAMGGKMWAESEGQGMGTTFRWFIAVPTVEESEAHKASTPTTTAAAKSGHDNSLAVKDLGTFITATSITPSSTKNHSDQARLSLQPLWLPPESTGRESTLVGKKILVVEPCTMVRQIIELTLRNWGCLVCSVATESDAIAKLRLKSVPPSGPPLLPRRPGSNRSSLDDSLKSRLRLEHSVPVTYAGTHCDGPFDVVIMDVDNTGLLHCLMERCREIEARRVVFTGWPGDKDPEKEEEAEVTRQHKIDLEQRDYERKQAALAGSGGGEKPKGGSSSSSPSKKTSIARTHSLPDLTLNSAAVMARPPKAITEEAARPGRRQLGYDVVTRPVRQERLKRALEEVLAMTVEDVIVPALSTGAADGGVNTTTVAASTSSSTLHHAHAGAASGGVQAGGGTVDGVVFSDEESDAGLTTSSLHSSGGASSLKHAPMKKGGSANNLHDSTFASNASKRLLIAEDNVINMRVALGILKRLGFTDIVCAEDGEAAVEAVKAAGGADAFFAILMDLHMPRKGGIDAARDIQRLWPGNRSRIIAVTADAFEDTRDTCIANGFSGWLAKPFRVEEFAKVMDMC